MGLYESFLDALSDIDPSLLMRRWVLGVSGGADSMALLRCVVEHLGQAAPEQIIVAHLDHALRDTSSADAEFVRERCSRLGVRCDVRRTDISALAAREGTGIEETARKARYSFLAEVARSNDAGAIAVAHTRSDQAETVLLRLCRGAGLRGLASMQLVSPVPEGDGDIHLIRPFLYGTREQVEGFVSERGIEFRHDISNDSECYTRNFVRHQILSRLRERVQPEIEDVLARAASAAGSADEFITNTVREFVHAHSGGDGVTLPRGEFAALHPAQQAVVLRDAFERCSCRTLSRVHIDAIRRATADSLDLPGPWRCEMDAESIRIVRCRDAEPEDAWSVVLDVPGRVSLPGGRSMSARVRDVDEPMCAPRQTDPRSTVEWVVIPGGDDLRRLLVRSRRAGDRFFPLGAGGSRTVKRFLIDRHVPADQRARVPIVTDPEGCIVWVAPLRIDQRVKMRPGDRRVIELELEG